MAHCTAKGGKDPLSGVVCVWEEPECLPTLKRGGDFGTSGNKKEDLCLQSQDWRGGSRCSVTCSEFSRLDINQTLAPADSLYVFNFYPFLSRDVNPRDGQLANGGVSAGRPTPTRASTSHLVVPQVQVDVGVKLDHFAELPVSLVLVFLICVDVIERIRSCRLIGHCESWRPLFLKKMSPQFALVVVAIGTADGRLSQWTVLFCWVINRTCVDVFFLQRTTWIHTWTCRALSSRTCSAWPLWLGSCRPTKARRVWPQRSRTTPPQARAETRPPRLLPACERPAPPTCTPRLCTFTRHPTLGVWDSSGGRTLGRRYLWRASCSGWTRWRWWGWRGNLRSSTRPGCSRSTSSPYWPLWGRPSFPTTLYCPLQALLCRTSHSWFSGSP